MLVIAEGIIPAARRTECAPDLLYLWIEQNGTNSKTPGKAPRTWPKGLLAHSSIRPCLGLGGRFWDRPFRCCSHQKAPRDGCGRHCPDETWIARNPRSLAGAGR